MRERSAASSPWSSARSRSPPRNQSSAPRSSSDRARGRVGDDEPDRRLLGLAWRSLASIAERSRALPGPCLSAERQHPGRGPGSPHGHSKVCSELAGLRRAPVSANTVAIGASSQIMDVPPRRQEGDCAHRYCGWCAERRSVCGLLPAQTRIRHIRRIHGRSMPVRRFGFAPGAFRCRCARCRIGAQVDQRVVLWMPVMVPLTYAVVEVK